MRTNKGIPTNNREIFICVIRAIGNIRVQKKNISLAGAWTRTNVTRSEEIYVHQSLCGVRQEIIKLVLLHIRVDLNKRHNPR